MKVGTAAVVQVAVAVIRNEQRQCLIARRPEHVHQGGKLEFPGGKIEAGESTPQALGRELHEELGITIDLNSPALRPLIKLHYDYGDKAVCLDVWELTEFTGRAHGKEGQVVKWMSLAELNAEDFPAANVPIITALHLPDCLMVSPDIGGEAAQVTEALLRRIEAHGVSDMVLRLPQLTDTRYAAVARALRTARPNLRLQLHSRADLARELACGLHLPSRLLTDTMSLNKQGISRVSASVHNREQLQLAEAAGADFLLAGTVLVTPSHPHADRLEWTGFSKLTEQARIPVYGIGGLGRGDVLRARQTGGQGVAGIRLFA